MNRIDRLIDDVAGLPARASYVWGGRYAPLATIVFNGIAIARIFSPLQWIKHLYRTTPVHRAEDRVTSSARSDVPAFVTDCYFLLVLGVSLWSTEALGELPTWCDVLVWVFIIEAGVWVVYYALLRPFVEPGVTLFHPAEYLVQLPLVITAQVGLIALASGVGFLTVLTAVAGGSVPNGHLGQVLVVLRATYFTVALAAVVNSLPAPRSRPSRSLVIIGSGEVSRLRIIPALCQEGYTPQELHVFDTASKPTPIHVGADRTVGVESMKEAQILKWVARHRVPAIIATPTESHIRYVASLAASGIPFAVEKPICGTFREGSECSASPGLMETGFALGYYALEKALPLTYLLTLHHEYRDLLETSSGAAVPAPSVVAGVTRMLGAPRRIDIRIIEGFERSPEGHARLWTEIGGMPALVETTIHPLQMVAGIVGEDPAVAPLRLELRQFADRAQYGREHGVDIAPTFMLAEAIARGSESPDGADLRIVVGKYAPRRREVRRYQVRYEHGVVFGDFDAQSLRVGVGRRVVLELRVKQGLERYTPQVKLFRRMMDAGGWTAGRFDDLDRQVQALSLWESLCGFGESQPVTEYARGEWPTCPRFGAIVRRS